MSAGRFYCRQWGLMWSGDSGWMMISIWKNYPAKNNSSKSESVQKWTHPNCVITWGMSSHFSMQGTPYSLREAIWPGLFPEMWSCRCIWWFELESLLEMSQAPKQQKSSWGWRNICWVPKEMQKDLTEGQVSKAAIFSLLAPVFHLNFWAAQFVWVQADKYRLLGR